MSKEYLEYLKHILDECSFLRSVGARCTTKEELIQDEVLKRAVVRSLEIIGEATKKIPADVKANWGGVQWKSMAGMRDRLIHEYMGVNYSIVWDVVKNRIPELHDQIQAVINDDS